MGLEGAATEGRNLMLAARAWMQEAGTTNAHQEELYNYVAETQDLMRCLRRHAAASAPLSKQALDDQSTRVCPC